MEKVIQAYDRPFCGKCVETIMVNDLTSLVSKMIYLILVTYNKLFPDTLN